MVKYFQLYKIILMKLIAYLLIYLITRDAFDLLLSTCIYIVKMNYSASKTVIWKKYYILTKTRTQATKMTA